MIDISFEEEMSMLRYYGYDADAQMYEDARAREEANNRGRDAVWLYGMRLRGCSIGCQPKNGFFGRLDDKSGKYYDIIVYERPLKQRECDNYDLDFLGIKEMREVM